MEQQTRTSIDSLPSDEDLDFLLAQSNGVYSRSTEDLHDKGNQSKSSLDLATHDPSSSDAHSQNKASASKFFGGLHGSRYNFNRLVNHYGPLFTRLDFVISLYQWKNEPIYSWFLLMVLWTLCLFPGLSVVCGPHVVFLGWIGYKYYLKYGNPNRVVPSKLKRKVYDMQNILHKLTQIDLFISIQLGRLDWSNPTETYRIIKFVLFSYPFWAVVSSLIPFNLLCLMGGTTLMAWHHPKIVVLRKPFTDDSPLYHSIIHSILTPVEDPDVIAAKKWGAPSRKLTAESKIINEKTLHLMTRPRNEPPTLKVVTSEMFEDAEGAIEFQLLEHQRKWPGLGWTTRLINGDPFLWTDENLKFVEQPKEFVPPVISNIVSKIVTEDEKIIFLQTQVCWRWIDDDWTPVVSTDTDPEGWEYSGRKFDSYSKQSGATRLTRRRRWSRKAIKITKREKLMDYLPEVVEFDPVL